jgi:hypothetical protein
MTLTEFLLARVAEDEALTVGKYNEGAEMELGPDDGYASLCISSARVIAECESRRRIIQEHSGIFNWFDSVEHTEHECTRMGADGNAMRYCGAECGTLMALAMPYTDHPDCQQRWKS